MLDGGGLEERLEAATTTLLSCRRTCFRTAELFASALFQNGLLVAVIICAAGQGSVSQCKARHSKAVQESTEHVRMQEGVGKSHKGIGACVGRVEMYVKVHGHMAWSATGFTRTQRPQKLSVGKTVSDTPCSRPPRRPLACLQSQEQQLLTP